ncbi:MAG TPA: hypothetical protein VMI54_09145 [Polyangiaceae bacterium]|nr:hypothetical protein [Polyangiaceae bacterium]
MIGSLALVTGAASCSTGEPTAPPEYNSAGNGSGATTAAGSTSTGASGMHGGMSGAGGTGGSTGGSSATGGTGGSLSTGGTGTGGSATGGSVGTGGSAGLATGGGSGTGSSTGGMSGHAGSGATGAGGRSNGGAAGRSSGGASSGGTNNGGMSSGGTSNGGSSGFGNNGGVAPPADISGGSQGWASRYWDCCKPACGWTGNTNGRNPIKSCDKSDNTLSDNNATNACQGGGTAFMCWKDAPWAVGDDLAYGFAAASGSNYVCGRCFHIQFDGGTHNGGMQAASASLKGKHMIVQVINNGGVQNDQFDLLIPGGGVGALNACTSNGDQLGSVDLGAQYGGLLTECNGDVGCTQQKCNTAFAGKQDLLDGCNWFLTWFAGADNPSFTYKQIACPSDITNLSGLPDSG